MEEGVFTDKSVRTQDLERGLLFELPSEVAPRVDGANGAAKPREGLAPCQDAFNSF